MLAVFLDLIIKALLYYHLTSKSSVFIQFKCLFHLFRSNIQKFLDTKTLQFKWKLNFDYSLYITGVWTRDLWICWQALYHWAERHVHATWPSLHSYKHCSEIPILVLQNIGSRIWKIMKVISEIQESPFHT